MACRSRWMHHLAVAQNSIYSRMWTRREGGKGRKSGSRPQKGAVTGIQSSRLTGWHWKGCTRLAGSQCCGAMGRSGQLYDSSLKNRPVLGSAVAGLCVWGPATKGGVGALRCRVARRIMKGQLDHATAVNRLMAAFSVYWVNANGTILCPCTPLNTCASHLELAG